MKKMRYGSFGCEVIVVNEFAFHSEVKCLYDRDTVAYAVEHFFVRCSRFTRECTTESWQIRIAKSKARRLHRFSYLVPSVLMELPGRWERISGDIDAAGINVKTVELLREHPCFAEKKDERKRQQSYKSIREESKCDCYCGGIMTVHYNKLFK